MNDESLSHLTIGTENILFFSIFFFLLPLLSWVTGELSFSVFFSLLVSGISFGIHCSTRENSLVVKLTAVFEIGYFALFLFSSTDSARKSEFRLSLL